MRSARTHLKMNNKKLFEWATTLFICHFSRRTEEEMALRWIFHAKQKDINHNSIGTLPTTPLVPYPQLHLFLVPLDEETEFVLLILILLLVSSFFPREDLLFTEIGHLVKGNKENMTKKTTHQQTTTSTTITTTAATMPTTTTMTAKTAKTTTTQLWP